MLIDVERQQPAPQTVSENIQEVERVRQPLERERPLPTFQKVSKGKRYFNKNTESNISNQAFSFISTEMKSSRMLRRAVKLHYGGNNEIYNLYYTYARILKRTRSKYINKHTLTSISTRPTCKLLQEISNTPAFSKRLSIRDFSRLIRILLHYFLSEVCQQTVLSSRKLLKENCAKHLERRREILKHLND